jgi:hypothetical protein
MILTTIFIFLNFSFFRPHRHTRSSSLDLQRVKLSNNNASQNKEASAKRSDESFADFTQFPDQNVSCKSCNFVVLKN